MQKYKSVNDINIVIVDYKLSNLFSVQRACEVFGYYPIISCDKAEIENADAIILPGVGAFKQAVTNLKKLDLIESLRNHVVKGQPLMGVCLGMQLLFEESEEFGATKGLGLIAGKVRKFESNLEQNLKVPQVAWNKIFHPAKNGNWCGTPLEKLIPGEYMYFVHSFYVEVHNAQYVLSKTIYGNKQYCSSTLKGNIFGTQFHPEKSGKAGLTIYKNWLSSL